MTRTHRYSPQGLRVHGAKHAVHGDLVRTSFSVVDDRPSSREFAKRLRRVGKRHVFPRHQKKILFIETLARPTVFVQKSFGRHDDVDLTFPQSRDKRLSEAADGLQPSHAGPERCEHPGRHRGVHRFPEADAKGRGRHVRRHLPLQGPRRRHDRPGFGNERATRGAQAQRTDVPSKEFGVEIPFEPKEALRDGGGGETELCGRLLHRFRLGHEQKSAQRFDRGIVFLYVGHDFSPANVEHLHRCVDFSFFARRRPLETLMIFHKARARPSRFGIRDAAPWKHDRRNT